MKDLLTRDQQEARLVTLTGPGGTGKTRLAVQAAADLVSRFSDGVYFVDLAPIREPEAVLTTIARTVAIRESSDRRLLDEIKEQLQSKAMLLVLDNFEQVTAAAPIGRGSASRLSAVETAGNEPGTLALAWRAYSLGASAHSPACRSQATISRTIDSV